MAHRRLHRISACASLSIAIAAANSGCADTAGCDFGGCETRLVVIIQEPGRGAIAPGSWEFQFVLDGGESLVIACDVGANSGSAHCDAPSPRTVAVTPLIVDGPGNPVTLFQVSIHGEPERGPAGPPQVVELTAEHDGALVINATLEPEYALVQPDCDGACVDDIIDVVVDRG